MIDNIDYIQWFVHEIKDEANLDSDRQYQPDFYELEQHIHYTELGGNMDSIKFVTEEQQQLNYEGAVKKLNAVEKGSELGKIASEIYKACNDKEGGNFFFMGKDQKSAFWDAHSARKSEFAQGARKELDGLLNGELTVSQAKQINRNIYNSKVLDIDTKKEYWAKFKEKVGIVDEPKQEAETATNVA